MNNEELKNFKLSESYFYFETTSIYKKKYLFFQRLYLFEINVLKKQIFCIDI